MAIKKNNENNNSIKVNENRQKVIVLKRTSVLILTMSSKKFKKSSYCSTLPHQVQRSKGTKNILQY